ncbi:MAG: alpha/beta hydrolase [Steroidobacteraceae bacterium]
MYVSIGGIEQWIQWRGPSDAPILLYLHGGPGGTSVPVAEAWRPWEEYFTVVHWDQRGAGRTFAKNEEAGCGPLTIRRMLEDALEVVGFLTATLRRPKVLIVGHSWGTVLGVHLTKRRPDLVSAYVGSGQLVNKRRNEELNYRRELAQAQRCGNTEALSALRAIGPPPFADREALKSLRQWADALAEGDGDALQPRPTPIAPEYSRDEVPMLMRGAEFSQRELYDELETVDLPSLGLEFEMPFFIFHGTCDQATPIELAEEYFAAIEAPHKEFVRFEGCHHFVVMNRPGDFLRELVARVVPHL